MFTNEETIQKNEASGMSFKQKIYTAVPAACAALSTVAVTAFAEGSAAPVVDLTGVNFDGLTAAITSMVPQVLPVVVTVLGIRKAISFMMSCIRGC